MASNQVLMEDGTVNDTVTSKELAKPKDNEANVALHKQRYLHYIDEKYNNRLTTFTAMYIARENGRNAQWKA